MCVSEINLKNDSLINHYTDFPKVLQVCVKSQQQQHQRKVAKIPNKSNQIHNTQHNKTKVSFRGRVWQHREIFNRFARETETPNRVRVMERERCI